MLETVSIIAEGIVQGVYYRQSAKAIATDLNITGEVKNKKDGSVHIIATGTATQLEQLIEWCNKGPERAIVTNVKVEKIPLQIFISFSIVKN